MQARPGRRSIKHVQHSKYNCATYCVELAWFEPLQCGTARESALERLRSGGNPVLVVTHHARYFPAKE
jgi:TPP-dependent pyruvate/acetoin dehydrogenase alpha subunit